MVVDRDRVRRSAVAMIEQRVGLLRTRGSRSWVIVDMTTLLGAYLDPADFASFRSRRIHVQLRSASEDEVGTWSRASSEA